MHDMVLETYPESQMLWFIVVKASHVLSMWNTYNFTPRKRETFLFFVAFSDTCKVAASRVLVQRAIVIGEGIFCGEYMQRQVLEYMSCWVHYET